ncbi:hypothetical protein CHU32_08360 [Superficieibacter electus]|uniref:Uncharacterized protein n=1 Tax=Superficieibacter electus TaxID=2022662 RepID=A0A2P5GRF8_9ENTR|nr:hypothetical protein CHU33_06815 [Superficieibacter electus]POP49119.1 hypothetical protein CHU32_08360 [Superficieibacter electus]
MFIKKIMVYISACIFRIAIMIFVFLFFLLISVVMESILETAFDIESTGWAAYYYVHVRYGLYDGHIECGANPLLDDLMFAWALLFSSLMTMLTYKSFRLYINEDANQP